MADVRGTRAAVITDPTTGTRQMAVNAGGAASVILAANSGVDIGDVDVTSVPADPFGVNADAGSATGSISAKLRFIASTGIPITGTVTVASHAVTNAGTFVVQENGAALTALQLIDDAIYAEDIAAQAADKGISILAVRRDADTTLVGTDNDYANLQVDANGYLKVEIFDGGGSHTVDGTVAATQSGTWTVDLGATDNAVLDAIELDTTNIATNTTDLPNVIGTDGAAGPTKAFSIAGTESGGNLQEIRVDSDGNLQVDVLSGGGADIPASPGIDITNITTPVSIAAGASANLDTADLVTKKLHQAQVAGSAPFKVIFSTLANAVATVVGVAFGDAFHSVIWNPPHPDFVVSGSGAGADGFRAAVTNLDPADTTDFYAAFYYAT